MKILQFAFSTDASDKFLPHNYERNFIVYSGTHDNDTSVGWYQQSATDHERDFFRRYLRSNGHDPAWSLIDAAFRSVAMIAIAPLQDMLSLGSEARMNLPGRAEGNWTWRFTWDQFNEGLRAGCTRRPWSMVAIQSCMKAKTPKAAANPARMKRD